MKSLDMIVDNIYIDNADDFSFEKFEAEIKEQMPDYDIVTWDMDDINSTISLVIEAIARRIINSTIEDIQYREWTTGDCELYVFVVAIKTTK